MRDNTLQRIKVRIQFNLTMAQIYLRDINFKTFEHVFLFTSLILLDFECHLFRKYDTAVKRKGLQNVLQPLPFLRLRVSRILLWPQSATSTIDLMRFTPWLGRAALECQCM